MNGTISSSGDDVNIENLLARLKQRQEEHRELDNIIRRASTASGISIETIKSHIRTEAVLSVRKTIIIAARAKGYTWACIAKKLNRHWTACYRLAKRPCFEIGKHTVCPVCGRDWKLGWGPCNLK